MKTLDVVKTVVNVAVSVGVGGIVGNAIKCTTPDSAGIIKKVCVGIGSFVLSSMVADQATKYTESKIDETVAQMEKSIVTE